jgi:hypothetical protein
MLLIDVMELFWNGGKVDFMDILTKPFDLTRLLPYNVNETVGWNFKVVFIFAR